MAEVLTHEFLIPVPCDGCGAKIPVGVRFLWEIDSCCGGGCTRALCAKCVDRAAAELALCGMPSPSARTHNDQMQGIPPGEPSLYCDLDKDHDGRHAALDHDGCRREWGNQK